MKKIIERFHLQIFAVLTAATIIMCAWQTPHKTQTAINDETKVDRNDTVPSGNNFKMDMNMSDLDKAMKELDVNMANLDVNMKNLKIDIDSQVVNSLSKINTDEIAKQIDNSMKSIDWTKMQKDVDVSLQNAQTEIAKVDFSKVQNELKIAQDKLQSEEFKSQVNSEKLQKQINDAMTKAKEGMEKAKVKLQLMKDFTDALAADNLIDKKKGYIIEWKSGSLVINGKEQSKEIADKYRKYEDVGKIKMLPEGAEHF